MQRTPDTCRYRTRAAGEESKSACALVGRLLETDAVAIDDDVCMACCQSFEPTPSDLNPVVASTLLSAVEQCLESLKLSSAERDRLAVVQQFAEASLPILLPTDDDLGPELGADANLSVADIEEIIPPREGTGSIASWSVGVTTAFRRQSTLEQSLNSLANAGWDRPHLFVDGDVEIPAAFADRTVTRRSPAIGAWPNYHASLLELLLREPNADAYMIVQDDAYFPAGAVRQFVENNFWTESESNLEVLSLYCCRDDQSATDGWAEYSDRWRYGAVAIAFSRDAATEFVQSAEAIEHGRKPNGERLVGIDDVIGRWLERIGLKIWRPTPSLVEHIGDVSTLWATARAVGVRAAGRSLVSRPRER